MTNNKMQVEIWSDVMCPFCYIGKHRFEAALKQFDGKKDIEITWKSYQLSPDMVTDTTISIHEYLSKHKGIPLDEAKKMNDYVTNMAKQSGLDYHLDKAVVANSFKAHRFSHYAKQEGKQIEAEEALFRAYFTEGKNLDDNQTLMDIGKSIGLDAAHVKSVLESKQFSNEVETDIYEAQQIGVRGVPFFVFNRKYAISGAQDVSAFTQTLEKSYGEWKKE